MLAIKLKADTNLAQPVTYVALQAALEREGLT
jgi:hypothetical protein